MIQLFQFLARQRVILLLLLLELVNIWAVFKYNAYQHSLYFNTTNQWAASILATTQEVKTYHQLRIVNGTLAAAVGIGLQLWLPGALLWVAMPAEKVVCTGFPSTTAIGVRETSLSSRCSTCSAALSLE